MHYNTVVCGAGLAGLTAALASLCRGKTTAVIARGESSLYYASGYLDLYGNIDNPWTAIDELILANPGHPFGLTNPSEKSDALEFFAGETRCGGYPYAIPASRRNHPVPTCTGGMRYTYLLPDSAGADLLADPERRVLAVGFADYRDFSVQLMMEGLMSRGYHWTAVEIDSGCPRKNQTSIDLAAFLDDSYPALVEKLKPVVNDYDCLVFPAVLGLRNYRAIAGKIEETFGTPVFEVPTLAPSLLGIRLNRALISRMRSLGGDLFPGFPATGVIGSGNWCQGVMVATPGRRRLIEGESYILATGGIAGGGIVVEQEEMRESVFGIPVAAGDLTGERFRGRGQGYAKSGIRVNREMRPVGPDGKVVYENVFCAGRTLAGYDPFIECDGAGVAIVTGYQAAQAALRR